LGIFIIFRMNRRMKWRRWLSSLTVYLFHFEDAESLSSRGLAFQTFMN
jgi:hypothetical protein